VAGYRRPHVLNPYNVGRGRPGLVLLTVLYTRVSATRVLAALHRNPLPDWGLLFCDVSVFTAQLIYLQILIVTIYFKNTVLNLLRVLLALSDQSDTPENCGV